MGKILLSIFIILALSSCKERNGPEPETSKFTGNLFSGSQNEVTTEPTSKPIKAASEEVFVEEITPIVSTPIKENTPQESMPVQTPSSASIVEDIPILEDDLPVIPEPILIEETRPVPSSLTNKLTFKGGVITDGLDMKTIRSSQNNARTRLVFDSYTSNGTATQSGNYTFTYNPSKKQITAVLNGYRKFSAMTAQRTRTFPSNSTLKNIKMERYMDDSGFKFSINLNKSVSVNIFELKSPARIVVDVTPN